MFPSAAVGGGGHPLTVIGSGFVPGSYLSCRLGGASTEARVINATALACATPNASAHGALNLSIATELAGGQIPVPFRLWRAGKALRLEPSVGAISGGTRVVVSGAFDAEGVGACRFGGVEGAVLVLSKSHVACTSPPAVTPKP